MIIVLGSVVARVETLEALKQVSVEHVRRSRLEPGCIHHSVQVDAENPRKLVFVEKWTDKSALAAHFAVKGSIDFVTRARELAAGAPVIEIFEASSAQLG